MVRAGSCYMTPSAQTRAQPPVPMASDSDSSFPNPSLLVCQIGVATSLSLVALTVKGVDVCQAFHDTPGLGFRLNTVSGSGTPDIGAVSSCSLSIPCQLLRVQYRNPKPWAWPEIVAQLQRMIKIS